MKKIGFLLLLCFSLGCCSLFRPESPYPTGIIFPLDKEIEIPYQGEIIDLVEKAEGNLYFSTRRSFVYCVSVMEQKILWEFEAPEPLASSIYLGLENIYVYDRSNVLYSLSREGKLLWEKKFKEKITSGIAEIQKKIYLGTERGMFFALNRANGEKLWEFQSGDAIRTTPVFGEGMIIFGCDDHNLYYLDEEGNLADIFEAGDKIRTTPLVEGKSLYFGADDNCFYCLGFSKRKKKWKIKTGARVSTSPVADPKRIFFLCWNSVLYCLNKKNGTILWWNMIPSRSFYRLEIVGKKIVASSFSSLLACFDVDSGKRLGTYDTGQEVKSNPIWLDPLLLVNLYDFKKDKGKLVFLKKEVKVVLEPSKEPPQKVSEEIKFYATATGFYKPEYEFYLKEGEKEEVVQEKSEKDTWIWFPEEEGVYVIKVKVVDEKEALEKEAYFLVSDKEAREIKNFLLFFIYTLNFMVNNM